MSQVRNVWAKIDVGLLKNRKIRQILTMRNGSKIVLVWIGLILLAKEQDDDGRLSITSTTPYDAATLAKAVGFSKTIVEESLSLFCGFEMMLIDDSGFIVIKNWKKYQTGPNQTRKEKEAANSKAYRERKKQEKLDLQNQENVEIVEGFHDLANEIVINRHQDKNKTKIREEKNNADAAFSLLWDAWEPKTHKDESAQAFANAGYTLNDVTNVLLPAVSAYQRSDTYRKGFRYRLDTWLYDRVYLKYDAHIRSYAGVEKTNARYDEQSEQSKQLFEQLYADKEVPL